MEITLPNIAGKSEPYVEPDKLTVGRADRLANIDNVASQFLANGRQQPVQLLGLTFRYKQNSTIGQILHVTGDGQPRCDPHGRVAEANALHPPPIEDLASFAMFFCRHGHPVIQNF